MVTKLHLIMITKREPLLDAIQFTVLLLTCKIPTISPKRPITLAKISRIRILTNRVEFWASARAAPEPTIPTVIPQATLDTPTVTPAANMRKPAKQFSLWIYMQVSIQPASKRERKRERVDYVLMHYKMIICIFIFRTNNLIFHENNSEEMM